MSPHVPRRGFRRVDPGGEGSFPDGTSPARMHLWGGQCAPAFPAKRFLPLMLQLLPLAAERREGPLLRSQGRCEWQGQSPSARPVP